MKFKHTYMAALLGICLIIPEAEARGGGGGSRGGGGGGGSRGGGGHHSSGGGGGGHRTSSGGGGGAKHHSAPQRSSSSSSHTRREPMTGSKVERPQSKPAPKQVSKPASKPQARPTPAPSKPSVKPDTRPANLPGTAGGGSTRPGGKPGGAGGAGGPDNRPGMTHPGGNKPSTLPGMVTYPNHPDKGRPGGPGNNGIAGGPGGPGGPGGAGRPGGPGGVGGPGDAGRPGGPGGIGGPGDAGRPGGPGGIGGPGGPGGPGGAGRPGGPGGAGRPGGIGGVGGAIGGAAAIGGIGGIGGIGDRPHIDNPNIGGRNQGLNRPSTLPANKRNWNNNNWGGNNGVWGNDVNINIDNRFSNNNNFAYNPDHWGEHPWWGAGHDHDWHHGHWDCGWNGGYYHNHWWYDDDDFGEGFMWGLTAWGLGSMVYNMGYQTYSNPYPAPPVENTYITYEQPMSVATAEHPPGDEATVASAEQKSQDALSRSLAAFKAGDYLTASKAIDEALVATPADVTLHEFRALVFFALGKYGEATGILNPVLASGPGWGWDTMIGFYDASGTYEAQLRKLEAYVTSSPDKADGHFLLGYHYMVCGYMDKAYTQFEKTAKLQPADGVARELRDLTKNSIPDSGAPATDTPRPPAPPPIPSEKLVGTWVSDRGKDGKITFTMKEGGEYTWNYTGAGTPAELKGTYGLNDKGLLVLSSDDSQMVSEVKLDGDKKMHFSLIGAPDGDPGLSFTKG